jgi:hypothetical protein
MKLQANHTFENFSVSKMLKRTALACLLVLVLFSTAAGSGPAPTQAYAGPTTIAYVRSNDATGDEIRLIEPDGSNDRLLWRTNVADLPELEQISTLAWHPAASELAFASRHEEACSFYNSDVYTIHSDGSGYRRVTAPPACGKTSGLPTGMVNVYIDNWTGYSGPFYVYFEGAPGPQIITLAPNSATMVTFTDVADYGSFDQWAVVVFGVERFMSVSGNADVIPGQTVDTDGYLTMWYSDDDWGWTSPTWKSDGSEISYLFGGSIPYSIPSSSTAPGMIGSLLFDIAPVDFPYYPDYFTWAPAGPRQDQLLYTAWTYYNNGDFGPFIFVGTAGSTSPGDALVPVGDSMGHILLGLAWLPDSSGFLYSKTEGFNEYANIYEYSFATGTSTPLTNYSNGYPRQLSISPDGAHVVYEFQANGDWADLIYDLDLWMMDRNGDGQTMFVQNARAPAWSPVAVLEPIEPDHYVFLPSVYRP